MSIGLLHQVSYWILAVSLGFLVYTLLRILRSNLLLARRAGAEPNLAWAGVTSEIIGLILVCGFAFLLEWAFTKMNIFPPTPTGGWLLIGADLIAAMAAGMVGGHAYYRFAHRQIWRWFAQKDPQQIEQPWSAGRAKER